MNPFDKPPTIIKTAEPIKTGVAGLFNDFAYKARSCDRCGMFYSQKDLITGKAAKKPMFKYICIPCSLPSTIKKVPL